MRNAGIAVSAEGTVATSQTYTEPKGSTLMHRSATQLWAPFWQSQRSHDYRTHLPRKPTGNLSTQMPSPDYLDKNKQAIFYTRHLGSPPPLFTRKWRTGKKQVGSPGPAHRTLQTEHMLKKSQDIIIFLTLVLPISTGQEEEPYSKKAEKRSQAKPRSHTSNTPIDKWTEHPTPG